MKISAWFILALFLCSSALADYNTFIDPSNVLVEGFEGWGTSLGWWANVVGGYTNRDAYADLAFNGLKLNIVRYNIGGGENPGITNTLQPRARMQGFETARGSWNWSADPNQRWILRAALKRGVNHVAAFACSPPYWMTVSGSVTGSKFGKGNNLRPECEADYAVYLATVINELSGIDGVTFEFISPMNEPGAGWWSLGERWEGNAMEIGQQTRILTLLRKELDQRGLHTGIAVTEDYDQQSVINSLNSYSAGARDSVSLIATHSYGANNPGGLHELAGSLGKRLWVSEYGDDEATGMRLARRIRDDLTDLRPQAWIHWQLVENDPKWGLLYNPYDGEDTAIVVTKKYYVVAQFSRFIRPGFQLLHTGDRNSLAGYDATNHTLVIVSVNDSVSPIKVTFDLNAFDSTGYEVIRHRTSGTENLTNPPPLMIVDKRFASLLAPRSVTTHVISNTAAGAMPGLVNDNTIGTGVNQFEYTGTWQYYDRESAAYQHDNHWSGQANDAYRVRFNGTGVRVCGARDALCGIAAVSVDDGKETFIDFYAPIRVDQALVWTSPRLAPGAHTLRVRVTGDKNPASQGSVIPADRVEILHE